MTTIMQQGRKIMGRLAKGDDLLGALEQCCREMGLILGEVAAIGAVSRTRVGYYDQVGRKYLFIDLNKPLEILSLMGNISLKDGKPFVHAHVALADKDGQAWGGHLAEGTTVFACEFMIQEYQAKKTMTRQFDEATGLFLWPKTQT